jgi:hypothetical protein
LNRVRAERHVARGLGDAQPDPRFEPLPVIVDERNRGDGHAAELRREQGQIVEGAFGIGVENAIAPEGGEPCRFVHDVVPR